MTWKAIELEENNAEKLAQLIEEAEAIVIGIGAGMSAADGFTYIGERFTSNFKDFVEKYKFLDMLQASLFDFPSSQEYWAFQSRFVLLNYFDQPVGASYLALKNIFYSSNSKSTISQHIETNQQCRKLNRAIKNPKQTRILSFSIQHKTK